ncbi:MAG: GIY-YIG nuclease family protein [Candidatus Pacebacteria bacterium]|nr:GIY-YIG nuclease family protein [Candidatus Paceibacterota bacterium]
MYFTYAIENTKTAKLYIGHTIDLQARINRHNGLLKSKPTSYTYKQQSKKGWQYIYVEAYKTRQEARIREKQLKTAQGRKFIKQLKINPGP